MIVLLAFSLLAGAATAITPCVLPVLPALLSASGSGGRRRPLGVVAGLTLTFTITIVGFAKLVDGVGFASGTLRTLAIVVLGLFGVTLLTPGASHWIEARLAPLSRLGPRSAGDGFWSGLPVGGALGLVYAPCAGPILSAVIAVSASRGTSGSLVAVGLAYAVGSALVLLALSFGGRKLMDRVRRGGRGPVVQRVIGAVMVLTAVLMLAKLDIRFQSALASDFPNFVTDPVGGIERSHAVQDRLAKLRGTSRFAVAKPAAPKTTTTTTNAADVGLPGVKTPALPVLGNAPDFTDTQRWFNSPPLTMKQLRGRVVLVDFWTYTCINCLRTLPYLKAWDARYRSQGLTIVGVHTPEFDFEKEASNVAQAIKDKGLKYPVVQDNDYGTWNAYTNQAWPADYLIDARGRVRLVQLGEGEYSETEAAIRALLAEAGDTRLGAAAKPEGAIKNIAADATPETYIGTARAEGFTNAPRSGSHEYRAASAGTLPQNAFTLGGSWTIGKQQARAGRAATISARVVGRAVYLVLSSDGNVPRSVYVLLDGKPIAARDAGADVHRGVVTVRNQRLYALVRVDSVQKHLLTLRFDPGVSGFAFTFG